MKKIFKSKIIFLILVSFISISAVFAYSYIASDVGYTPTDTEWNVDNTKDALDDLYDVTRQCVFGCPYRPGDVVYERTETISDKFTSRCDGLYQIEVWGAQGGGANGASGGYGAYAVGVVSLEEDDVLYVNVGGKPADITSYYLEAPYGGGFNGGGKACGYGKLNSSDDGGYGAGGGGATSVSFIQGELASLESYKGILNTDYYISDDILIVAAGGGGAGYWRTGHYGGDGGGISGTKGHNQTGGGNPPATGGGGGTQISGGTALAQDTRGGFVGNFGKGGDAGDVANDGWAGAGGGGGFYGGGSGNDYGSGGGGGSSYIASSKLMSTPSVTKAMYCYNCTSSSATQTKTISVYTNPEEGNPSTCPNGHSVNAISKCPKEGDGSIKITFLGV